MKVAVLVFTIRGFDAGCKDKGVKAAGAGLCWAARADIGCGYGGCLIHK